MNKTKIYWLTTAALLVPGTDLHAADLPFRKAAPVEYVRVCDAFGAGFFYVPGTDTCLRVSGQIRGELTIRGSAPTNNTAAFAYNQAGQVYRRDLTSFRARGYLNADSRTQTAYGTVRAFASMRITLDTTATGPYGGRGDTVTGVPARVSTAAFQGLNPTTAQPTLDKGFIQFAGITAGRAQSFFDFDAQSYELLSNSLANSNQVTEMFAYTATFGGGFSATISAEDRNERTIADNGLFVFSATSNPIPAGFTAGNANNPTLTNASILAYAGETVPDIVGNIAYSGSWGQAQLSGAYHQVKSIPVSLFGTAIGNGRVVAPEADGFAVLGGVKILLPTLAKGDSLTLQGTYEQGAMDYVNPLNYQPNGITNVYDSTTTGLAQQFGIPVNDAFINPNGTIGLNHAVGGYAAFRHYFDPNVYSSLYGDYLQITNPASAQRLGAGTDNARIYQIGFNTIWTPVKDLQIGGEVLYTNLHYSGLAVLGTTPVEPDDIRGRFTIRRSF